ncbi:hypothetical protein T11_13691, partial [Trichinella zimbabwensis]
LLKHCKSEGRKLDRAVKDKLTYYKNYEIYMNCRKLCVEKFSKSDQTFHKVNKFIKKEFPDIQKRHVKALNNAKKAKKQKIQKEQV